MQDIRIGPDGDWRPINDFERYLVSETGLIWDTRYRRIVKQNRNQQGIFSVVLTDENSEQHRKSVSRLVACAFLEPFESEAFDTPINLDGNRDHNYVTNLMWRPRWFAMNYHKQFKQPPREIDPFVCNETGEEFTTLREPAVKYGLLERDILHCLQVNQTRIIPETVWPTYQTFWFIEEFDIN